MNMSLPFPNNLILEKKSFFPTKPSDSANCNELENIVCWKCRAQLAEIMAKVQTLKDKYDNSTNAKAELEAELDDLNVR